MAGSYGGPVYPATQRSKSLPLCPAAFRMAREHRLLRGLVLARTYASSSDVMTTGERHIASIVVQPATGSAMAMASSCMSFHSGREARSSGRRSGVVKSEVAKAEALDAGRYSRCWRCICDPYSILACMREFREPPCIIKLPRS